MGILRNDKLAILWSLIRIYLGIKWFQAGWYKISGGFDASGFLKDSIKNPEVQIWYAAFLENVALPNISLFNFIIPWGEFLVGLGLVLGMFTIAALYASLLMSLNFILTGVIATNPIFFAAALILLILGKASYRWGVDYYVLPRLKELIKA